MAAKNSAFATGCRKVIPGGSLALTFLKLGYCPNQQTSYTTDLLLAGVALVTVPDELERAARLHLNTM